MQWTNERIGYWWRPGEQARVAGSLQQQSIAHWPDLNLLEPHVGLWGAERHATGFGARPSDSIPVLHGHLDEVGSVTLLNCRYGGSGIGRTTNAKLRVGLVVEGAHLDGLEEQAFSYIEFEAPSIARLLPRPYLIALDLAQAMAESSGPIETASIPLPVQWRDEVGQTVWKYTRSIQFDQSFARVEHHPVCTIELNSPTSLRILIEDWIIPMSHLITIMSGTGSQFSWLHAWPAKPEPTDKISARHILHMAGVGEHVLAEPHDVIPLVSGAEIAAQSSQIRPVLDQIKAFSEEYSTSLQLILESTIGDPDRPKRLRFLELTFALEALHSTERGQGPVSPDSYRSSQRRIIGFIASHPDSTAADLRFAKRWLPSRSHYSLEKRLSDLASRVGVQAQLSHKPSQLAELRNRLAHGEATDDAEIETALGDVALIARLNILHVAGLLQ